MRKLTFLFALLCASMMSFATQYCGETSSNANFTFSLMNVSGNTYRIQFDVVGDENEKITSINLVNIGVNQTGGAGMAFPAGDWVVTPDRAYVDFTTASGSSVPTNFYTWAIFFGRAGGGENAINSGTPSDVDWTATCTGGGGSLTDPELSLNETAVTLDATVPETFQIVPSQNGDGAISYESSNSGIASVDNTGLVTAVGRGTATITVRTAETATYAADSETLTVTINGPINWNSIGWLGNGSGNAAYTNKYKVSLGDPAPSNVVNIQTPGWPVSIAEPGIYVEYPSAAFGDCSIDNDKMVKYGAGVLYYMSVFTAQETVVSMEISGVARTFTVYYADGTTGGSSSEPTEIYDVNFALQSQGGVASAKSGNEAGLANNGNTGDRWWSATDEGMTDAQKNDQWWQVDLGQRRIFNTIQIVWEGAWGKSFDIQTSNDGSTWTTVKEIRNQNLASETFPYTQTIELDSKQTAQFVRFQGIERGTGYAYSFWEFRVLLPGVQTLTSISLTSPAAIAEVSGAGVALTAQPKDQNGQNMEAAVSWEITPAAAGHMSGNTFIPDQIGAASIRAYNGEVFSPAVTIAAYEGSNVALEKEVEASGYDTEANLYPAFAVDNNEGSLWSARVGETGEERIYDAWIIVDLGAFYDINLIALRWEGACSRHYHVDFSEDKSAWRTAYNAGWDAIATHWEYLIGTAEDATKVRYVRVLSTEAVSQYGVKIMDLKVFGIDWVPSGDTEAPVMTSASLVSSTSTSAIIAVAATDEDGEVARYHVVDATNGIDANYVPEAGNITITGLTHATSYNFTITAIDLANHESENSIAVPVSTPFDVTINLALNKTCEAGYEDGNPAEVAAKVNDGNEGTLWVTYANRPAAEEWWYVDLGDVFALSNITTLWGANQSTKYILQTRVNAPSAVDKADDAAWITIATVTGAEVDGTKSTDVSGIGRFVRFRSIERNGDCIRLKELRVFGTGKVAADTEKPVMGAASLVSNTDSHAIINVSATDNTGIASYHVVDTGNSIDANFAPTAGQITVTGLTGGTNYTLVIKAVDLFGNESDNSQSVSVTTTAHYTEPQAACATPTWPAAQVKAMYSPTYEADYTHQDWGGGTVYSQDTYGKKYVTNGNGYFGAAGFSLNCLMMEKLHYDIWIENDATIRFVPIWGGAEQGITKSLVGQQWNSIDIDLTAYTGITNWGNIDQMKIDQAANLTFWVANAYFYRETAIVDGEAPTNVGANVTAIGFHSVMITASAEDNSGAVSFKVMNGDEIMATGAAVSGVETTIAVNGLASGTAYNFNVVAYDNADNEADPVAVAATTKTLPAPAPAPVTSGKVIVPVYSDAIAGSKTGIQSGGWGETTAYEWLEIAPNDQVFYGQNFNYAGWHSWGASIVATDMMFLHVDFYSTGMTQVSVTPISPGHEGVANCTLTPNAWTSVDVPLSTFAASNIDWSDIFQFKFMSPVGGNELMIDNVYFWQPKVTTTQDNGDETGGWASFSCAEKVAVPDGMKAYKAAYEKIATEEVLTLTEVSVIPAGAGVILKGAANTTYTFLASDEDASDMTSNVLVGCPVRTDVTAARADNDIFCMRYSELFSMTGFFLYEGQYVPAGKAYLALPKQTGGPSGAPRKVRFVIHEEQVATDVENVGTDAAEVTKFVENGQLFIRRGDAVYTIQGTRVQ